MHFYLNCVVEKGHLQQSYTQTGITSESLLDGSMSILSFQSLNFLG